MKVRSIYALVLACAGASSTAFAQQAATQPASATTAATDSVESQILELQKEWEEKSARFQQRLDQLKN
jgi:TolA-binding protein